ncbi:MAG TPA: carboxypeptidase-like regulatory domain-containing protein [Candidatus Angelobacter sp.]|jgi:hypothetical protein|nr:carboxypeptidase-like regulatory domain-containing protein [Candidatus Angelobacter sp.]
MTRKFGLLAVLFITLPALAAPVASVSGYVKNTSGMPQMGAMVEVFTSAALVGTTVFTDARGYYSAENLRPGLYYIKATAASFLPSLREKVSVRTGTRALVNLTLTTLADALQLLPARRSSSSDPDDWHWTLRSTANRPILRVTDDGPELVCNPENGDEHALKARLAFVAGAEADGFGSAGEVTTSFSLEKSLFTSGLFSFNGNIDSSSGDPNGVVRASYTHDFGTGARPRFTVTYRHLASPGLAAQNAAYSAVDMTTSNTMSVADFIDLDYGASLQAIDFTRRVSSFRPFGSVDIHLSPNTVIEYRYATSIPETRSAKGFDSAPADLSESGPHMALTNGLPEIEHAQHQEVSASRRFGKNSVQVAYYVDRVHNLVLTGAGDPSSYSDNVLPDIYSGTFSYGGGSLNTSGTRVVLQRKFSPDFTATADYSTGGVVALAAPVNAWQNVSQNLTNVRRHSIGGKFAGYIPSSGTRWVASYKWTSGNSLLPVDEFNASPGQVDPYFSFFIRQSIPGTSFIPAKMEAIIDMRNLLAQGYVPVLGRDGRRVYLVQAARAVRGGLAFSF